MVITLDMSKAYDRAKWGFLNRILLKMGFQSSWVNRLMSCIKLAYFSLVINGVPRGLVSCSRGLHQRNPLSPYLFLFVTKGFISLLKQVEVDSCSKATKFVQELLMFLTCYLRMIQSYFLRQAGNRHKK